MSSLKLVADAWLLPLPLALLLGCIALALRFAGRRRGARITAVGAVVVAVAATLGPVANLLLMPLETRYPGVLDAARLQPPPRYVAVLGSGYSPRMGLPVTAALDATGVVRLAEGVRLLRQLPGAQLIVSGGPQHDEPPIAHGYALAAAALGVPPDAVILLDTPRDTAAEMRALHARIGDAALLLVTSAAHMPRAMALSRREGLHAVAAPTGNLLSTTGSWSVLPSGRSLYKSEVAVHEYAGLLALHMGLD
jgi:uncharacterized SAM-binding protein YcdF (DUF218 family)